MAVSVDPKIEIKILPDGEVHILFSLSNDDLAELARAFVASMDGKLKPGEAKLAFRLRSEEGIDYLIEQLQAAKQKRLFGLTCGYPQDSPSVHSM